MEHIAASTRSAAAIAYGRAVETADTAPRHQEITRTSASTSTVCELPAARTARSHLFERVGGRKTKEPIACAYRSDRFLEEMRVPLSSLEPTWRPGACWGGICRTLEFVPANNASFARHK